MTARLAPARQALPEAREVDGILLHPRLADPLLFCDRTIRAEGLLCVNYHAGEIERVGELGARLLPEREFARHHRPATAVRTAAGAPAGTQLYAIIQ